MSEQQNEIDSATTTLATKMVTWLSPLTQAVGKNIDLPLAAADSGGSDPVAWWMIGRRGGPASLRAGTAQSHEPSSRPVAGQPRTAGR